MFFVTPFGFVYSTFSTPQRMNNHYRDEFTSLVSFFFVSSCHLSRHDDTASLHNRIPGKFCYVEEFDDSLLHAFVSAGTYALAIPIYYLVRSMTIPASTTIVA